MPCSDRIGDELGGRIEFTELPLHFLVLQPSDVPIRYARLETPEVVLVIERVDSGHTGDDFTKELDVNRLGNPMNVVARQVMVVFLDISPAGWFHRDLASTIFAHCFSGSDES